MDRQNVAYDLSMYESLLEPRPKKKEEPKQTKVVKIKNKYAFKNVVNILSIAVVLSLIIGVIWTNAEITKTTNSIAAAQNAITEAESEKAYLACKCYWIRCFSSHIYLPCLFAWL